MSIPFVLRPGLRVCGKSAGVPLLVISLAVGLSACASRGMKLPEGPGQPFPDYRKVYGAAAAGCRDLQTMTLEASVSGTVGRSKIRGRVLAGFERPGRMRLEAVAPSGPPVFILAADGGQATLLMPRASEVLAGELPESVLEALVGVSLRPDDLQAILAGCVAPDPTPRDGQRFGDQWVRVDLGDGSAAYLRQEDGAWRIRAGLRPLLSVEYEYGPSGSAASRAPLVARLRSTANGGAGANLRLALSQVEINVPVAAKAFTVAIPSSAVPITLEDLRQSGPLGAQR